MLPLFFVALLRANFLSRQNMKNVKEEKNGQVQEQLIQHDSTDNADAGKKRKEESQQDLGGCDAV